MYLPLIKLELSSWAPQVWHTEPSTQESSLLFDVGCLQLTKKILSAMSRLLHLSSSRGSSIIFLSFNQLFFVKERLNATISTMLIEGKSANYLLREVLEFVTYHRLIQQVLATSFGGYLLTKRAFGLSGFLIFTFQFIPYGLFYLALSLSRLELYFSRKGVDSFQVVSSKLVMVASFAHGLILGQIILPYYQNLVTEY